MCSMLLRPLLALPVVVVIASHVLAQQQEMAPPTLSSGLRGANAVSEEQGQLSVARSALATANLPPIEAIGPDSDIRPFLDPGVPLLLTQAALRRAWVTDPAIRDFIGPSENSENVNTSDAVRETQETENPPLSGSNKNPMGQLPSGR